MRRKEREVIDLDEKLEIVAECMVCRIGMSESNRPYVVPMNFGFEFFDDHLTLYFHSAHEGKMLSILKENPNVCFEMDCGHKIIAGKTDCDYSMEYKSIIGDGYVEFINDRDYKIHALDKIMNKITGRHEFSYDEKVLKNTCVFVMIVSDFCAKKLSQ